MIGFLRFVGILNGAVWFGSAIFFTFVVGLVPFSEQMKALLGPNNYPYFSGAIAEIYLERYLGCQVICAAVAGLHLLAEWLYLGKSPARLQVGLLIALASVALLGGLWLEPKMKALHATKYGLNTPPEIRAAADRTFRAWHGVSEVVNLLMVGGLTVYLWRATNPSDPTRYVSAVRYTMR